MSEPSLKVPNADGLDIQRELHIDKFDEKSYMIQSLLGNSTIEQEKEITEILRSYNYLDGPINGEWMLRAAVDTLKIIPKSLIVSLSFITTNFLTAIGFFILNRKNDFRTQAAFGIYMMLRSQFYFIFILGLVLKMAMGVSQSMGQRANSTKTRKFFTQAVILWVLFLCGVYIPFIFCSPKIMPILGFSNQISEDYFSLALKNLPNDIIFAAHIILMEYCFAQGIGGIFSAFSWIILVLSASVCLVLSEVYNWGFSSWILGRFIFFALSFSSSLWIYLTQTTRASRGFCSFREVYQDFYEFAFEAVLFSFGNLFEWIGWDIAPYFNALNHNTNQVAAMSAVTDIRSFLLDGGLGFQVVGRTTVNYLLGAGMVRASKRFAFMTLIAALITGSALGGILYSIKDYLGQYYSSNNQQVRQMLQQLIVVYSLGLSADMLYAYTSALMRSVNHAVFWTSVWMFFGVAVNIAVCWYLRNHMESQKIALYYFGVTYIAYAAAYVVSYMKLLFFDWFSIGLHSVIIAPGSPPSRVNAGNTYTSPLITPLKMSPVKSPNDNFKELSN
jgi:Na+-driven multidrug efflux pump